LSEVHTSFIYFVAYFTFFFLLFSCRKRNRINLEVALERGTADCAIAIQSSCSPQDRNSCLYRTTRPFCLMLTITRRAVMRTRTQWRQHLTRHPHTAPCSGQN
jgi:hypothetical protein